VNLETLTPEEVALILRIDKETVYRNLRQGRLPGAKVGGQWRTRRADLDGFLTRNTTNTAVSISGALSKD